MGNYPNLLRVPSCLYRALAEEVAPLLMYSSPPSASFMLGSVTIQDANDGT